MSASVTNSDAVAVARSLLLDREAGVVLKRLESAGIPAILLKGAAIATWLYQDGSFRPYIDVDLLVAPSQFEKAIQVLAEVGYVPRLHGADPAELGPKEIDLLGPRGVCIDLHHGLLGTTAPEEHCWKVLWDHTTGFDLPGTAEVRVLDIPARAMHLALHAAQNGPIDRKALTDLERGLALVGRNEWHRAAAIAEELGAAEALAAGMRLTPAGRALADELGLTTRMSVELALRVRSAPQDAIFFERLSEASGLRERCSLIRRKLFPTPVALRANSKLAQKGSLGLLCAWLAHPFSVATRLGPAVAAWRQARRQVGTGHRGS